MTPYTYELQTVRVSVSEGFRRPPLDAGTNANDPESAAAIAVEILRARDADQEHFIMLALDGQHQVTGFKVISSGTDSQTPVSSRRVFRMALELDASGIVLAHNHPSGKLEPSRDDTELTRRLWQGGEIVGIPVLDHIITSPSGLWLSLRATRPGVFASQMPTM